MDPWEILKSELIDLLHYHPSMPKQTRSIYKSVLKRMDQIEQDENQETCIPAVTIVVKPAWDCTWN